MRKLLGVVLLAILSLVVSACGGDEQSKIENLPPIPQVEVQSDENKPVTVDVYWDATYSMQGYTTIPQQNMYQSLPDNLEDIGVAMGAVNFFRFGGDIQPLEGRQHRQFMDPGFYTEVTTEVNKVIENADSSHLSIVVTDLFETDADWSNVARQIKAKYFDQHQSVAIIGVKNPFMGDIFDIGYSTGGKVYYDSGNDAAKYRPFYIMAMGNDADVRSFIAKCKERFGTRDNVKYLLLSDKLVASIPYLKDMDMSDTKNLFNDNTLNIQDNRILEMGINDLDEEVDLSATFGFEPYGDVCKIDVNKLKPLVIVNHLQDGEWVTLEEKGDIAADMKQTDDGSGFKWNVKFMPRKVLSSGSVNLLEIFITPGKDGLQLPSWVQEWNVDSQDIFAAGQFDGTKTVNLVRLISSLKDNSVAHSIPSVANAFVVMKY